jgi:hypothetical protein
MAGFFKSKQNKEIEEQIFRVGSALHKQVANAKDEIKKTKDKKSVTRMVATFTAGYMFGYVQSEFSEFSLPEKKMNECMKKIFDGIFLNEGYSFVMSKIEEMSDSDQMGMSLVMEKTATEFGQGMDMGCEDAIKIKNGAQETTAGLADFILTGKME